MKKMQAASDSLRASPLYLRILIPVLTIAVVVSAILVPLFLSQRVQVVTGDIRTRFNVGSLSDQDIKATETFHYIDQSKTAQQRNTAAAEVLPHFSFSLVDSQQMLQKSHEATDNPEISELVQALVQEYVSEGIYDSEDIHTLREQGIFEIIVENETDSGRISVALDDVLHTEKLTDRIQQDISILAHAYPRDMLAEVSAIVQNILRPNVHPDRVATAAARQEAFDAIEPVVVRVEKGEYLIKKDMVITEQQNRTLQAMRLASVQYTLAQHIGRIFFVLIITAAAWYGMYMLFQMDKRRYQYMFLFLAGVVMSEVLVYITLTVASARGFTLLDPILPLFAHPILIALLTNKKQAGMITALMLGSYTLLLPSGTISTVYFIIAIAACGIYFIRYVSRRIDMVFQWFFGILSASFLVVFHIMFSGLSFSHLFASISAVSINMSVTYILVTLMLPLVELAFNLPTPFRLRELAYSDSPQLVRLSQTAVGTYNHSLMVSEMAYAAAKEIHADALLARVAGLYHDIGKQEHPEYFIENQEGDNKHHELKASLSVAVIKSHVKIGVEKGRQARLPQEVLDIISQHHGNDVIAIFLKEAQKAAQNDEDLRQVKRQDYAYNNQIPQSPEAALVMLADSVEAASRTVKKPSAQRYEKLVNQIIMSKIERKQLGASRLSLTDLETITRVFVQILTGRFHSRIEYPDEQTKEKDD
jgi:putative nucleotidyltransferase with HDIG domain